jgi:hypothetical protein
MKSLLFEILSSILGFKMTHRKIMNSPNLTNEGLKKISIIHPM